MRACLLLLSTSLLLASCGSDGGDQGSGSVVTPAPAPAPTPSPSPSPTPTPTAVRYTAEADGPLVGALRFYPSGRVQSGDFAEVYTNRAGVFRAGQSDSIGPSFGLFLDYRPTNALSVGAIDPRTRLYYLLRAPVGATTVSPLTTLIYEVGDKALTLAALQLSGNGLDALPAAIDPLVYSASQEIAGVDRPVLGASFVVAANVRVIALLQAAYALRVDRGPFPRSFAQTATIFDTQSTALADFIRANPQARLFTQEGTEAFVRAAGGTDLRPDVVAAAARLVNRFGPSASAILNDPALSSAYMLAIEGYLFPRLRQLIEANTPEAAARADAITAEAFSSAILQFRDLPSPAAGIYFAGPDFIRLKAGTTGTLSPQNSGPTYVSSYADDDLFIPFTQAATGTRDDRARSVSVPARFAAAIAVDLIDDRFIRVRALPGFVGIAYADYQVQPRDGVTETGRIWVSVE